MEQTFWLEHWAANKIGFHRPETNPFLMRHWAAMDIDPADRVFVPLCGKSLDMVWLAEMGHEIVGVELSPLAIQDFFTEQGMPASSTRTNGFVRMQGEGITLFSGDFFKLGPSHVQPAGAVYDRGALIALPEEMRRLYVEKLAELAPAPVLLITTDYDQNEMPGPPFAVSAAEVRVLYEDRYDIHALEGPVDILDQEPIFAERGVTQLAANVFRLVPR